MSANWPCWHGPTCSGTGHSCGAPIVESPPTHEFNEDVNDGGMTADDQVRAARKIADDAAADVLDRVRERRVEAVLAAHHLSSGGRNLGQYRTEWTCACGATFVTDGHRGGSVKAANDLHVAAAIVAALNPP